MLELGLKFVKFKKGKKRHKRLVEAFGRFYGAPAAVLVAMWNDLCTTTIPEARVPKKERKEKGVRSFLAVHHFFFSKPKNTEVFSMTMDMNEQEISGKRFWKWVERLAALKKKVIVWPEEKFMSPESAKIVLSLDCTDCQIEEPKHPTLNQDSGYSSHKFKKAGLRYEIALDLHEPKIVWINGPYKAGSYQDITIFKKKGLKDLMLKLPGKKGMADGGYEGEEDLLCMPCSLDGPFEHEYKSRSRIRHECVNNMIKKYRTMDSKWNFGKKKHALAFVAICVTVQYKMDNGLPIWDV